MLQYGISGNQGQNGPYSMWRIRIRIKIQIFQIQWIHPFSAQIQIRKSSESSFDMDSLVKLEVASVSQT